MKQLLKITLAILGFATLGYAQDKNQDGIFAEINTTKGKIVVALEFKKTPITVANFISLTEGTNTQVKEAKKGKPYYNGLNFHRVIANFMIQGGCPDGNGSGDPGYKFTDEITDLTHEGPGVLSMANAGAGTNGSQFFITHKETGWLNGKHTVFGHVISGQEVVDKIAQGDLINSVVIIRNGKDAKKFKAEKVFAEYFSKKEENDKIQATKNDAARKLLAEIAAEKQKKQAELEAQKRKEIEQHALEGFQRRAEVFVALPYRLHFRQADTVVRSQCHQVFNAPAVVPYGDDLEEVAHCRQLLQDHALADGPAWRSVEIPFGAPLDVGHAVGIGLAL